MPVAKSLLRPTLRRTSELTYALTIEKELAQVIAKSVISQYRFLRGRLLFAASLCPCLVASGAAQLVPAIEKPATTNKVAAVVLAPLTVASIRQVAAADSDPMTIRFNDDGVSFRDVAVAWVVQQAFSPQPSVGVQDDLFLGLPSWTRSERYDIEAKVDNDDVAKWKALSLSQREISASTIAGNAVQSTVPPRNP